MDWSKDQHPSNPCSLPVRRCTCASDARGMLQAWPYRMEMEKMWIGVFLQRKYLPNIPLVQNSSFPFGSTRPKKSACVSPEPSSCNPQTSLLFAVFTHFFWDKTGHDFCSKEITWPCSPPAQLVANEQSRSLTHSTGRARNESPSPPEMQNEATSSVKSILVANFNTTISDISSFLRFSRTFKHEDMTVGALHCSL